MEIPARSIDHQDKSTHLIKEWLGHTVIVAMHLLPWPSVYTWNDGDARLRVVPVANHDGVVHLLLGWLALQIAWGLSGRESADTSGAMKTLADQPFGQVLLWLVAVGLAALALWQASSWCRCVGPGPVTGPTRSATPAR
jgi:hypothetical protein